MARKQSDDSFSERTTVRLGPSALSRLPTMAIVTFSLTNVPEQVTNAESRLIEGAFPEGMPQRRERAAVPAGGGCRSALGRLRVPGRPAQGPVRTERA